MSMMLYGLLVGIDRYHPASQVRALNGSVNDIRGIQDYLERHFPAAQRRISVLLNEEATRAGVIGAFAGQIAGAPVADGDIVLFYFCGHGSYAPSAPEFIRLGMDTMGQDETLVLYDSRIPGGMDLADKELALLLASVHQGADIVVIVDACHSGSVTRESPIELAGPEKDFNSPSGLGEARYIAPARDAKPRALNTYAPIGRYDYSRMNPLAVPDARYLLLAACRRDELAYESTAASGVFSGCLLRLLNEPAFENTYANLYEYLAALVNRRSSRQHPQIRVYEGFDPDRLFLGTTRRGVQPSQQVAYVPGSGVWVLNKGALHGLSNRPEIFSAIEVLVYERADAPAPIGYTRIQRVLLERSIVAWNGGRGQIYFARLMYRPPFTILVEGPEENAEAFLRYARGDEKVNQGIAFIRKEEEGRADFHLALDGNGMVIRDPAGGLVHGLRLFTPEGMDYILGKLLQLARWTYLSLLDNGSTGLPVDQLEFMLETKDAAGNATVHQEKDITLEFSRSGGQGGPAGQGGSIPFSFRMKNNSGRPLFASLFHLSSGYKIVKLTEDVDAAEFTDKKTPGLKYNDLKFSLDGVNDPNGDTDIYKLVIADQLFSDYYIPEKKAITREILDTIPGRRALLRTGTGDDRRTGLEENDWAVKTIVVRQVRKGDVAGENKALG